jgi:nucleotide-binding universal stress UspA family protein
MAATTHSARLEAGRRVFSRILVGIDGSPRALETARQAARLQDVDGQLTLLSAWDVLHGAAATGTGVPTTGTSSSSTRRRAVPGRWLRDFMQSFAAEGKTVLVSSHVLAEVQQSVDQVVIINKGRLVTFEPLAQLTGHVGGGVRVRAPGAHRPRQELEAHRIRSSLLEGDELLVEGEPSARIGELAFAAGVPVHELIPQASSLEDVFLELTAEGST